ncbi:hypothetical protein DSM112329_02358 [Paraconexibacter sp. AEG42_29]|uniref:Uncharacterized protein n=1 Tax=Paraconexibacter sp. AEG42_29 TaxID=2997339 RepID=A0AAU7AV62_9ACTN
MAFLRRLLTGSGRLPDDLRTALEAEGIVLLLEELPGSTTYRNYRAPGKRSNWKKQGTSGAIAVTGRRVVAWTSFNGREVDVPRDGPLPDGLEVVREDDAVCFTYDAAAFHADRSGTVEVRLRTDEAGQVVALATAGR